MKHLLSLLLLTTLCAENNVLRPQEDWPVKYRIPTRSEIDKEQFSKKDMDDEVEPSVEIHEGDKTLSLEQEVTYYFGTFVSTSPYPGVRATYFGSELMSQLSNVNKDLQILIELEKYKHFLKERNLPYYHHPRVFLSGLMDGYSFVGHAPNQNTFSDIDFGGAEIGFLLTVNPWLNSIVVLEYDNSQINIFGDRVNNSRIQVQTGMIMLGDLDASPFYTTIGQTFVPFGQYTTYAAIERPLTRLLFRTLAREIALGYYDKRWQGSVFTFKGGSFQDKGQNINNFGANLSYLFEKKWIKGKVGAGVIRNIANSQLQLIAFNPFSGPKLKHVVPGAFVNGDITLGPVNIVVEYLSATKAFDPFDMAFSTNGGKTFFGAKPAAIDAEIAYIYKLMGRDSTLSFGYSQSSEALGFATPKRRMLLTATSIVAKGALLSFEIGHDRLYNKNNRAAGKGILEDLIPITTENLGHSSLTFGVDFLVYW